MLTVQSAASDRNVLTLDEMRAALSISDSSQDAALTALGLQLSDAISNDLGIRSDGVHAPTLLRETLIEKFRLSLPTETLILSRRFIQSVASVVVAGETLTTDDYEVDRPGGRLRRLDANGFYIRWPRGLTTVTYDAGFDDAPGDVKLAARTILQNSWASFSRNPHVKMERFEGLGSREFFEFAQAGAGAVPVSAAALLDPYRSARI